MSIHDFPYRSSPFAHLCYLVSEALRGPALNDAPNESARRAHWLDRIDQWVWRNALKRRDSYLAESTDLADLEHRLRGLERGIGARYY
jgi:hypothetical protein